MKVDDWWITDGMIDEQAKIKVRPGATIHYHRNTESCITGKINFGGSPFGYGCYGVVWNERARTIDGTVLGQRVQVVRVGEDSAPTDTVQRAE